MPKVLKSFLFQERPLPENGVLEEPLHEPIQIASDFEPEHLAKKICKISNKCLKESSEPSKKQVESSANKEILTSLSRTGIPLILTFCLIASAIISITKRNKYGEMGHPWNIPRFISKALVKKNIIDNITFPIRINCINPVNKIVTKVKVFQNMK